MTRPTVDVLTGGRRTLATVAVMLVAPAPTLGVVAAMIAPGGDLGRLLFLVAKAWLLVAPALWWLAVERGWLGPVWPGGRKVSLALAVGVGMGAAILLLAPHLAADLDPAPLRASVLGMGLGRPAAFLGAAAAWTLVNSLVEEIVYRGFLLGLLVRMLPAAVAVPAAAGIFACHHAVALSVYLPPGLTVVATAAVFGAGVVWGVLYLRTGAVTACWISHVLADVAVFATGWRLLWGA